VWGTQIRQDGRLAILDVAKAVSFWTKLRPFDLTSYDAKLVPEKKELRFRVVDSQPHINQIEEQPKPRVHESEEHRRSKC
jgi:hypothetical protein